jgi:hypothetical protein
MRLDFATTVTVLALTCSTTALAQVCEAPSTQQSLQYLRRLSLDVRNHVPDVDEVEAVVEAGGVDDALIDEMFASEEWTQRMRRYHLDQLWTVLSTQQLTNPNFRLTVMAQSADGTPIYWVGNRANVYRGFAYEPCNDEPVNYDALGNIATTPSPSTEDAVREGWIEVNPYWAPDTTIKVCAFDAQIGNEVPNPLGIDGTIWECSIAGSSGNPRCGCGPNLDWCQSLPDLTEAYIDYYFAIQLLRFSDEILAGERPYTDFIAGRTIEINGPISHFLRHQTWASLGTIIALPDNEMEVPEIPFDELETWETVQRVGRHSGVVTMPAYLLRFATNRARAARFYEAFLCQSFEPPPGGLPAASDPCNNEPNLTKRCGCDHCHKTLEPAAAHWGRYAESGFAPLLEEMFPTNQPACINNRQSGICRFLYVNEAIVPEEEPYLGMLRPYLYADAETRANIEQGPTALAADAIASGAFAECTVKKMWRLMMAHDPGPRDAETIAALTAQFEQDFDLKTLLKTIVKRPEYVEGSAYGEGADR